ncbi:MAG: DegV family protein [Lachnospiraceae bacterium]|nr:DegV family protein [Lachnospiraceae bacterium]
MSIRIITDSTSELSQKEAKDLNISVVPLKTIFGEKEYLDGIDITPQEFYAKLSQAKELPTTSQPSPAEYEKLFREAQDRGEQIITICIAERLSGTYQSANIAKGICGGDITVIDSGNATIGLQILVRLAIKLRDEGKTAAEITKIVEEKKKAICLYAAIDTLEFLHKGGRLSRTSAIAGTLLSVKPILSLFQSELNVVGKCKGQTKAYTEVFQLVKTAGIDGSMPFAIGYTGERNNFERFQQICQENLGENPLESEIGSVIGTHAGPGAVAIAFFKP